MRRSLSAVNALLVLTCTPVGADPITVTSGSVVFTDEPGEFLLVGRGFELSGWMFPSTVRGTFWFDRCHPDLTDGGCLPGGRIDFGTTTYGIATTTVKDAGRSGASCTRISSTAVSGRSLGRASLRRRLSSRAFDLPRLDRCATTRNAHTDQRTDSNPCTKNAHGRPPRI